MISKVINGVIEGLILLLILLVLLTQPVAVRANKAFSQQKASHARGDRNTKTTPAMLAGERG